MIFTVPGLKSIHTVNALPNPTFFPFTPSVLQKHVRLSDKYPSGLEWATTRGKRLEGSMAGTWVKHKRYYLVRVLGGQYSAHRLVYFLRNNQDPGLYDVIHEPFNYKRDNRENLHLIPRKERKIY